METELLSSLAEWGSSGLIAAVLVWAMRSERSARKEQLDSYERSLSRVGDQYQALVEIVVERQEKQIDTLRESHRLETAAVIREVQVQGESVSGRLEGQRRAFDELRNSFTRDPSRCPMAPAARRSSSWTGDDAG